jgi:HTH-type transcriptional regulator/antitoxin HigA
MPIATTSKISTYHPDYLVPPGSTLLETIDVLGIDQRELTKRSCLFVKHLSQLINGKSPISQDFTIAFERGLSVPARFWNTLESNFQKRLAQLAVKQRLKR